MARRRYDYDYGPDFRFGPPAGVRHRMGMHDFTEHYGRYSGGPSYAYEYTERTIEHPYAPHHGSHGFTRLLHPRRGRRFRPREERRGWGARMPRRRPRRGPGAWYRR